MPQTSPGKALLHCTVAGVMALALAYLFFGNTAFGQARRLRMAGEHQPLMEQAIASESRFAKVSVGCSTANGGCMLVVGMVSSQGDLESLRRLIETTKPPVPVTYMIDIRTH
jgi:hypothetical protein